MNNGPICKSPVKCSHIKPLLLSFIVQTFTKNKFLSFLPARPWPVEGSIRLYLLAKVRFESFIFLSWFELSLAESSVPALVLVMSVSTYLIYSCLPVYTTLRPFSGWVGLHL